MLPNNVSFHVLISKLTSGGNQHSQPSELPWVHLHRRRSCAHVRVMLTLRLIVIHRFTEKGEARWGAIFCVDALFLVLRQYYLLTIVGT